MAWLPRLPFTATPLQVTTYLLGVALFSISFLVFLNSALSFVIRDLIGQHKHVGNAVGTLGFADELLALVACPVWGLLSDRIGVRNVTVLGYALVGLALFVLVQASNVYPQLLLARLLFSLGGAATSTMVTAILPSMIRTPRSLHDPSRDASARHARNSISTAGTDATVTPVSFRGRLAPGSTDSQPASSQPAEARTSQTAGLVGMFTGIGALLALGLFLPLPTALSGTAGSLRAGVIYSFYVVGSIAFLVALFCFFGLRNLSGETGKGFRGLFSVVQSHVVHTQDPPALAPKATSLFHLLLRAVKLGFTDAEIGLGYLGGLVARASSVAISLFIPLYVNAYFISTGRCKEDPRTAPSDIKNQCERAYKLAAALTGVSELVALLCAPLFGYIESRYRRFNLPVSFAALVGVVGYTVLGHLTPDPKAQDGGPVIFLVMALVGVSQIGAIVCSLSILARGIEKCDDPVSVHVDRRPAENDSVEAQPDSNLAAEESAPLLEDERAGSKPSGQTRDHLKGSIAGVYSFAGGFGILMLTKLGGYLFDELSHGTPFYMMSIVNAILLVVGLAMGVVDESRRRK